MLKGLWAQPSARGMLSCAAELVISIFLLQTWIPSSRFWFCLNGVAWYLSVQAFLYAIFPWLLAVLKKVDTRRLRCIAAAIFCPSLIISIAFPKHFILEAGTSHIQLFGSDQELVYFGRSGGKSHSNNTSGITGSLKQ